MYGLLSFFIFLARFLIMEYASCWNFSFQSKDLGCGLWLFGCSRAVCNLLVLFFMFGLGLKVLRLSSYSKGLVRLSHEFKGKSGNLKFGFCSASDVDDVGNSKCVACKDNMCRFFKDSIPALESLDGNKKFVNTMSDFEVKKSSGGGGEANEEDTEDIPALKKLIRIERDRADEAYLELEKERMAAASAAEEAMAMILRLQNEKSSIEMQAHHYRTLAAQKQLHDQEVIQSLRWIILKHESDRNLLENQLKLCRQRLRHSTKIEEGDQMDWVDQTSNCSCSTIGDDLADVLISSLDMDASSCKFSNIPNESQCMHGSSLSPCGR